MNILFLTNNNISFSLKDWLQKTAVAKVVLWQEKLTPKVIADHQPDLVISYNYKHIIKSDVLNILPGRVINLHIALLPWNRGADPNVWSILDATPKGVTIHLIDQGVDTGGIIIQKEVELDEAKETLASSYAILHQEIQALFKANWQQIKILKFKAQPQAGLGTAHRKKDFELISSILGNEGWDITIPELKRRYSGLRKEAVISV
ncbi:formyltransferase family protein [Candidatus Margulisiibacteriota bacterium]